MQFNSLNFQPQFTTGYSPGVPFYGGPQYGGAPVGGPRQANPAQMQQMFKMVLSLLTQLASGYQGFGGQNPGFGMGQPGGGPQFGGYPTIPQPSFPNQPPFGYYPSPGTPPVSKPQAPPPPKNLDFSKLSKTERTQLSGLNDSERGALHLWGIQVTSAGKNNGGIYFNVLNNPDNFQPAEVALVKNLYNQEMSMFGGVTGKLLDQHFFGVYEKMTGQDISARYNNRPLEFANGPVNMDNRLSGNNGLSSFDNTVIRLWGHDGLDNGANDGSVTEFTLSSDFALDKIDGSRGALDRGNVEALLAADLADGKRDGNALESAFIDSLDRVYFGAPGADKAKTLGRAGINQAGADSIIADWKKNPPPGIPAGVDITNTANLHKCPVLGPMVTQQGGAGGIQFG